MRLPWVSRDAHERAVSNERNEVTSYIRDFTKSLAAAERAMVASEARYAELLTRYHALKLQGFAAPAPEPVPPPVTTPDPVLTAVNQASAGKDPRVRSAMLAQVAIDRKAELDDERIILRIQRGNRPGEELDS